MPDNLIRKGIILAGGRGTRLYPATRVLSKQLLPIYDKPMIYYPLATLMEMGIREILIISTPLDLPRFESLFGDGNRLGLTFYYAEQPQPEGIAQAYLVGREFIGNNSVALILGDNYFSRSEVIAERAGRFNEGAMIFGSYVENARRYGVIEQDDSGQIKSLVEKPENPRTNYAMTGLYLTDSNVCNIASNLKPSARGELEIVDVMNDYLNRGKLQALLLDEDCQWIDAGTPDSLQTASQAVQNHEKELGKKIACLEEIAYRKGYIDDNEIEKVIDCCIDSEYGQYLSNNVKKIKKNK